MDPFGDSQEDLEKPGPPPHQVSERLTSITANGKNAVYSNHVTH